MTSGRDPGRARPEAGPAGSDGPDADEAGRQPSLSIATVGPRQRLRTTGRIESVHIVRTRDPVAGRPAHLRLECELDDGTGSVWLVFLGQYEIPGLEVGARVTAEGVVNADGDELRILNPIYRLHGTSED